MFDTIPMWGWAVVWSSLAVNSLILRKWEASTIERAKASYRSPKKVWWFIALSGFGTLIFAWQLMVFVAVDEFFRRIRKLGG